MASLGDTHQADKRCAASVEWGLPSPEGEVRIFVLLKGQHTVYLLLQDYRYCPCISHCL